MNMKPTITIVSIIVNVLCFVVISFCIVKAGGLKYVLQKIFKQSKSQSMTNPLYKGRLELLRDLHIPPASILMIGDSITQGGEWHEFFPGVNILNRGIGTDTSSGVFSRIESYLNERPSKIFLLIGINDLQKGVNIFDISDHIEKIIDIIKNRSKTTNIYIQSVLPCNENIVKANQILSLNDLLKNIAHDKNVTYIDLYIHYLDKNGSQNRNLFIEDCIHLSPEGYSLWVKQLKQYI
jgi:lysophospholipase L1-like esterase